MAIDAFTLDDPTLDTPGWADTNGAAKHAACHPNYIRKAIREGLLPAARIGTRYRLRLRDVDAWLLRARGRQVA